MYARAIIVASRFKVQLKRGGALVLLSHKIQDQVYEIDSSLNMS